MDTRKVRTQVFRKLARQMAALAIAASVLLQPLYAGDSWSRVKKLKEGTWVYLYLSDGKYREGSLLRADDSAMNVRVINQGEVAFDRGIVLQVAVNHSGRHWYSVPLAVAAAAAGGAAGHGIAERTTCFDTRENCGRAKGVIIGGLAIGSAAVTYGLTRGKEGRKVIYTKGR